MKVFLCLGKVFTIAEKFHGFFVSAIFLYRIPTKQAIAGFQLFQPRTFLR